MTDDRRGRTTSDPPPRPKPAKPELADLPEELHSLIDEVRPFATRGDKGAFFTGVWRADGTKVMVKAFPNTQGNVADIWPLWRAADPRRVVRLVHTYPPGGATNFEGTNYEVTEYLEHGSLADYVHERGGALDQATAERVLREVTDALHYIHNGLTGPDGTLVPVAHRDVKPGNILVRSVEPLELCLADFGIARVMHQEQEAGSYAMTVPYAAPEASRLASPRGDWWSLGITMVELLQGQHPFVNEVSGDWLPDQEITTRIHDEQVRMGERVQGHWRELARGLLTWKAAARWTAHEIAAWFRGESPAIDERRGPPRQAHRPFTFGTRFFETPEDLAAAMAANWPQAAALVIGRRWRDLVDWSATVEPELRDRLEEVDREYVQRHRPVDRVVSEAIVRLAPTAAPVFHGVLVHHTALVDLARRAQAGEDSAVATVAALLRSRSLYAFSRLERHRILEQIDEVWQQRYRVGRTAVEMLVSLEELPSHQLLPGILLRVCADPDYEDTLRRRAAAIASRRPLQHVDWFRQVVERAERADEDAPAYHAVMLLAEPLVFAPGAAAGAEEPGQALPHEAAAAPVPRPRGQDDRRPPRWRPRRVWPVRDRYGLTYIPQWRSPRERVARVARAGGLGVLSAAFASVTGVGVAMATSPAQGVLVTAMLVLAGLCQMWGSLQSRLALGRLLRRAGRGGVVGTFLAVALGTVVGALLGPQVGWPVFWTAWASMVLLATGRGATR